VGFQSKGTAGTEERTGHAEGALSAFSGSLIYGCYRPDTAVAAIGIAVLVSLLSAAVPVLRAIRIVPAAAFRKVI
jgi:ABC-type antimicrobial peptide transport system permease subunit